MLVSGLRFLKYHVPVCAPCQGHYQSGGTFFKINSSQNILQDLMLFIMIICWWYRRSLAMLNLECWLKPSPPLSNLSPVMPLCSPPDAILSFSVSTRSFNLQQFLKIMRFVEYLVEAERERGEGIITMTKVWELARKRERGGRRGGGG